MNRYSQWPSTIRIGDCVNFTVNGCRTLGIISEPIHNGYLICYEELGYFRTCLRFPEEMVYCYAINTSFANKELPI